MDDLAPENLAPAAIDTLPFANEGDEAMDKAIEEAREIELDQYVRVRLNLKAMRKALGAR